ncbi:MAG: hypothetical protein ACKO4N_08410, partial [Verrucomicrobiota bacterium]
MPVAADQSILAAVAFSSGAIVAYAVAKWRENTLGALREDRLRAEVELARREATVEAAELHAQAEAEKREAEALHQRAEAEKREAEERAEDLARRRDQLSRELMLLGGLSPEEARRLTVERMRGELTEEAARLRAELLDRAEVEVEETARRTLLAAMQRLTTQTTQDATAVSVQLPNEEMKGRLIGREGRNIRAFE